MYQLITIALLIICFVWSSFAQDAEILKQILIGKTVTLKIEMPATDNGVDILADRGSIIKEKSYRKRLKNHGRAYRIDDSATITCVKVKKKRIEICLGGGGYKTLDYLADTTNITFRVRKSRREKDVEKELKNTTDSERREKLNKQLDKLKDRRDRENRIRQQNAETEGRILQSTARQKALEAGSRLVIRFDERINSDDLDESKIISILENYLEFRGK